ncbi:MAG: hypothetical protein Q7K44_02540 [Candidatus Liptonbacteria bacterium]|nr:hypothetical protein [Candidatus Liptonbacteria bacterium]
MAAFDIDYSKLPETLEAIAEWFCRNTAASRYTIMPATCLDAATAIRVLLKQNEWLKSDLGHNADWEEMVRALAEIEDKVIAEKIHLDTIVDEARREKARAINAF